MADTQSPPRKLSELSVLVVDDNANMRRLVLTQLRAFEVSRVREAGSGVEALQALADFVPDVIITDLAMQPMNGIEFVR
jgi:CheY-like chemotaxis protein